MGSEDREQEPGHSKRWHRAPAVPQAGKETPAPSPHSPLPRRKSSWWAVSSPGRAGGGNLAWLCPKTMKGYREGSSGATFFPSIWGFHTCITLRAAGALVSDGEPSTRGAGGGSRNKISCSPHSRHARPPCSLWERRSPGRCPLICTKRDGEVEQGSPPS